MDFEDFNWRGGFIGSVTGYLVGTFLLSLAWSRPFSFTLLAVIPEMVPFILVGVYFGTKYIEIG